ncbi:MAG: hypothetical protein WBP81_28850 [Solirubrobacteraceae bacterium]
MSSSRRPGRAWFVRERTLCGPRAYQSPDGQRRTCGDELIEDEQLRERQ